MWLLGIHANKGLQVELILPEEVYEIIQNDILSERLTTKYCRVILPLRAIVEGSFFDEYIKKGELPA